MLTVHHLNQSRSQRILWALEELALPYQIVRYQREKTMLAPPALKKCIHWASLRLLKITVWLLRNRAPSWNICRTLTTVSDALNLRMRRGNNTIDSGYITLKVRSCPYY